MRKKIRSHEFSQISPNERQIVLPTDYTDRHRLLTGEENLWESVKSVALIIRANSCKFVAYPNGFIG